MGHMIYEQGGVSQEAIDSMEEDGFDVVEMSFEPLKSVSLIDMGPISFG